MIFQLQGHNIFIYNAFAGWFLGPDWWFSLCYMMKFILNGWNVGYESELNIYVIQLTGPTTLRMNNWWLKDEWDWNSYSDSTIYLT